MCHPSIPELIRRDALSRRGFLGGCVAAGAAAGASAAAAAEEAPRTFRGIVDLTHALTADFPTYPGTSGFRIEELLNFEQRKMNAGAWHLHEHTGTHLDVPFHFTADGSDLAAIPVTDLYAPLVVIDIRERAARVADAEVTPEDLDADRKRHGPPPPHCCVVMQSGWSRHVGTPRFRGEADGRLHFPGFHPDAIQKLLEETQAVAIGVDTLSFDHGPSADFPSHRLWLPTGRWGIECLNLAADVPARGASLFAGCLKVPGGSGGPARVVAFLP